MSGILLFAVFAAVDLVLLVCQGEDMLQPLLDRSDTSWVPAVDDISDLSREMKVFLLYDLRILDDIDGDIVVNKA